MRKIVKSVRILYSVRVLLPVRQSAVCMLYWPDNETELLFCEHAGETSIMP